MKSRKIKISELKVESFVTELGNSSQQTAKGGAPIPFTIEEICNQTREPGGCNPITVLGLRCANQ